MIKMLITGIWICVVALASVYFSVQITNKKEEPETEHKKFDGLETIRGDITSIPVISDGAVQGYFLTRLTVTLETKKLADIPIPVPALVTDVLYTTLVGDQLIKFPHIKTFDLEGFKKAVLNDLNKRAGETVFHDVIVEQIDFLSKADIRQNMRGGGATIKSGKAIAEEKVPENQAKKAATH